MRERSGTGAVRTGVPRLRGATSGRRPAVAAGLESPPLRENPPRRPRRLSTILPDGPNPPYDVKDVIRAIVDSGEGLEVHEAFAANLVVGFARLPGHAAGRRFGTRVTRVEMVGLVPQQALIASAGHSLKIFDFSVEDVVENRLDRILGGRDGRRPGRVSGSRAG